MELLRSIVFAARIHRFRIAHNLECLRLDGALVLSGWCARRFVAQDGRWLIAVRQVNLIDCDQDPRNPSIVI